MRNLIDFLQKNLYWLVFLVLEVVSLISLFKYNNYQGSVYFTTANRVAGEMYRVCSKVTSYVNLGSENEQLETENEQLRQQLLALQGRLRQQESAADSLQLGDSIVDSYHFVQAQVVGATIHRVNNLLTIDKGSADGIRPEMGVVSSHGVAGIVFLTSRHYSVVISLLNTSSHISCRLRQSAFFGTLQWQHGDAAYSYVEGIPRHAKVKRGDVVETNGYSDIFPEGIPIGRVDKVLDSSDGMSYSLKVKLYTNFKTLRNVSVITDYRNSERILLEQHADSLAGNTE